MGPSIISRVRSCTSRLRRLRMTNRWMDSWRTRSVVTDGVRAVPPLRQKRNRKDGARRLCGEIESRKAGPSAPLIHPSDEDLSLGAPGSASLRMTILWGGGRETRASAKTNAGAKTNAIARTETNAKAGPSASAENRCVQDGWGEVGDREGCHSALRFSHVGLCDSIRRIFLRRDQPFNCFSR